MTRLRTAHRKSRTRKEGVTTEMKKTSEKVQDSGQDVDVVLDLTSSLTGKITVVKILPPPVVKKREDC